MRDATEAAAERLRRVHPDRPVHVSVDDDASDALGDWDRVAQILDNLVGNADRFAPPSTPIDVTVKRGARDVVVTRVADHGPGVPANLQPRVFERFVGDGQEGAGSTGLGLAIVKGLVEAHAGRVWLDDSAPDEGAAFAFSLPATPAAKPEVA